MLCPQAHNDRGSSIGEYAGLLVLVVGLAFGLATIFGSRLLAFAGIEVDTGPIVLTTPLEGWGTGVRGDDAQWLAMLGVLAVIGVGLIFAGRGVGRFLGATGRKRAVMIGLGVSFISAALLIGARILLISGSQSGVLSMLPVSPVVVLAWMVALVIVVVGVLAGWLTAGDGSALTSLSAGIASGLVVGLVGIFPALIAGGTITLEIGQLLVVSVLLAGAAGLVGEFLVSAVVNS